MFNNKILSFGFLALGVLTAHVWQEEKRQKEKRRLQEEQTQKMLEALRKAAESRPGATLQIHGADAYSIMRLIDDYGVDGYNKLRRGVRVPKEDAPQ